MCANGNAVHFSPTVFTDVRSTKFGMKYCHVAVCPFLVLIYAASVFLQTEGPMRTQDRDCKKPASARLIRGMHDSCRSF